MLEFSAEVQMKNIAEVHQNESVKAKYHGKVKQIRTSVLEQSERCAEHLAFALAFFK